MNEIHFEGHTTHDILEPSNILYDVNAPALTNKQNKGRELVHAAASMSKRTNNEKLPLAKRRFASLTLKVLQEDAVAVPEKTCIRAYAEYIYGRNALEGLETADMIGLTLLLSTEERAAIYAAATKSHGTN